MCKNDTSLDINTIKMDDFRIKGRTEMEEYIDPNDTLEGNRLKGNEVIIVTFNK